jgi:biopolymer transport protein ExbB
MKINQIIDFFGYAIYGALALLAVWGVYNAILLYRALRRKAIGKDSAILIKQVGDLCKAGKADQAAKYCQGPPFWHTALAQLIAVALSHRSKGLAKIKQILVMEFHTEVIAALENRQAPSSSRHDRAATRGFPRSSRRDREPGQARERQCPRSARRREGRPASLIST